MRGFSLLVTALFYFGAVLCVEEDNHTVKFTAESFKAEVPKKNHFIMFYAPWCGHCQRLSPVWTQLAELLNIGKDSKVTIGKVDCTVEKDICSSNDVTGYPTLKFFKVGESEGVKFRGIRDVSSLTNFINEQLGERTEDDEAIEPAIPVPDNGLVELTEDTFYKHVHHGHHFVKFYAPWCGHCQKLAPDWELLAESLAHSPQVSIAKVDCTKYRSVCTDFEVKGYPTLLWIEDGKKIEKYSGKRSHEDLKTYVNNKLGVEVQKGDDKKEEKGDGNSDDDDSQNIVATLTLDNFDHALENKNVFVKFYAPWCGHCKAMAHTWVELAKKFAGNEKIVIAQVDCTIDTNKKLCTREHIDSFPTLVLYRKGSKIAEYNGARTLEDMYDFITDQFEKNHDEL